MFQGMRGKVLAAITGSVLLVALVITMVFYRRSANMIEENYGENQYARIRQVGENLDESLKQIYYLTAEASCDEKIINIAEIYREEQEEKNLLDLADVLREYAGRSENIGSAYLIFPKEGVIVTSREYPVYEREVPAHKIRQIQGMAEHAMQPLLIRDPLRSSSDILGFVSDIQNEEGEVIAYVMNSIEERMLYYKYLDGLEDRKTSRAVLLDEECKVVSSREQEDLGRGYENSEFFGKITEGVQNSADHKKIGAVYQTTFSGYYLLLETEKREILTDLRDIRYFLAVILFVAVCAAGGLAIVITQVMYRPLRNLTEAMELVSEGNLDQRVEVTSRDEIGVLSKDFNRMLEHIQDLIGQLLKEEMLKKDAELEALQYQITPHFMYNTLNSIKYAALLKGEQEIGDMIEDFIELLQASINKRGTFVTVAEELHFVKNYMNLQRMRYEEEIQVIYNTQPGAAGCYLPRLMLQPLVENAILHGLDLKNGKNQIFVEAKVEDETLWLAVRDNGRGMSEEQIDEMMNGTKKKTHGLSGIGIANVKERLELYYAADAGIIYESDENGTTAAIYLPAYNEQDKYAL